MDGTILHLHSLARRYLQLLILETPPQKPPLYALDYCAILTHASFTITILILLLLLLINTHHITTSNTLTWIKIFHTISLQIASLAQSIPSTAGDDSQTTPVSRIQINTTLVQNYACFLHVVLFYTSLACRITQKENMHNLYWCSLFIIHQQSLAWIMLMKQFVSLLHGMYIKSTTNINSPRGSDNLPYLVDHLLLCRLCCFSTTLSPISCDL